MVIVFPGSFSTEGRGMWINSSFDSRNGHGMQFRENGYLKISGIKLIIPLKDFFYQNSLNKIMFILIPICELSPTIICNFIMLTEIKITKLWKRE